MRARDDYQTGHGELEVVVVQQKGLWDTRLNRDAFQLVPDP